VAAASGSWAPDGSEIAPTNKPQADGTLVKALARAWRWRRMLDDGVYTTVSEIGEAETINKSDVSRILRLALLAPDIVEVVLGGAADKAIMLERLERPLPTSWEEQRRLFLTHWTCGASREDRRRVRLSWPTTSVWISSSSLVFRPHGVIAVGAFPRASKLERP
jgi:hypothetical protein